MIPHVNGDNEKKEGSFRWKKTFSVKLTGIKPWCLEAFCKRGRYTWKPALSSPNIELVKVRTMEPEEYLLEIENQKITVSAANERGIIWALTSLAELAHGEKILECRRISDKPRYRYRGLLLDCVKYFFSVEEVKKVIDEIARVKMNVLHWHLGDENGVRVESMKCPKLHQVYGQLFYTQMEIREIVAYAKKRGVEVIPEIDMYGHASEIYPVSLCTGNEETYGFLKELLEEIMSLFDSQWFHIGGDKAPDQEWKTCVCCQSIMEMNHYTNSRLLQEYFLNRVKGILKELGKKAICWNDTQGTEIFEIDLSYSAEMISAEKVYHTVPVVQGDDSTQEGLSGMECRLWVEHITEDWMLEEYLFPRIYAFAEIAWYGNPDYEEFRGRMAVYSHRARERGIHCCPESE